MISQKKRPGTSTEKENKKKNQSHPRPGTITERPAQATITDKQSYEAVPANNQSDPGTGFSNLSKSELNNKA